MKVTEKIRILQEQIEQIGALSKNENHDSYESLHTHTTLLLKEILGEDANEVQEFERLTGDSHVVMPRRPDINAQRRTDAYFRDIQKSLSLLNGILQFLESINKLEGETEVESVSLGTLDALHSMVKLKCSGLYLGGHYPEAIEKGFKVVRDRLRDLTTFETGAKAFSQSGLYIKGAAADNVDEDFQNAVRFLTMAIDQFRNEKSHTSDSRMDDPVRAYEYLAISSLAMHLLDDSEVREKIAQPKKQQPKQTQAGSHAIVPGTAETKIALNALQIFALRLFAAMTDFKELLIWRHMGGSAIHPAGSVSNPDLLAELEGVNEPEFEANLDDMVKLGLLNLEYSSKGTPKYKLAKLGYDTIREHPELNI